MKMLKDLKEFLLRGNVVDLAVGVIIASAFGAIVTSFVNDIITPLLLNPALEAAKVHKGFSLKLNPFFFTLLVTSQPFRAFS